MNIAPRSSLPVLAVALLAALFVVRGMQRPALNYDVIPYAALAKEIRGDGGRAEAYQQLAAKVGASGFQLYVSGAYRERMYRDESFFQANIPLYTIRPFYILMCSALGALIHDDIAATYEISAVAAALALLLSYAIACKAGLVGYWRLAVPLTWIVAGGVNLASLSTPDALETLFTMAFVLIAITGARTSIRTLGLVLSAALMVTTRTDAVLLVGFLTLVHWLYEPRGRLTCALVFGVALIAYFTIQIASGNYGYIALLSFISDHSQLIVPARVLNLHAYLGMAASQMLLVLGAGFQQPIYLLAFSLLAVSWVRERRAREALQADGFNQHALILSAALAAYLAVRFALFPLPFARYVTNAYVLAGVLFARAIQPAARSQQVGRPERQAPVSSGFSE